MSTILNDNFTRANANPIGSPYSTINGYSACQIVSDTARGTVNGASNGVYDSVNSYPNDQWAQFTLSGTPANGVSLIVMIRISNANNASEDAAKVSITAGTTSAALNTEFINLTNFTLNTVPTTGDVYYLGVQGQTYTVKQNGAIVCTFTDSGANETTGVPGFSFFTSGNLPDTQINNFQTGNFIAAGPPLMGSICT